jgi:hypothetical protein
MLPFMRWEAFVRRWQQALQAARDVAKYVLDETPLSG